MTHLLNHRECICWSATRVSYVRLCNKRQITSLPLRTYALRQKNYIVGQAYLINFFLIKIYRECSIKKRMRVVCFIYQDACRENVEIDILRFSRKHFYIVYYMALPHEQLLVKPQQKMIELPHTNRSKKKSIFRIALPFGHSFLLNENYAVEVSAIIEDFPR